MNCGSTALLICCLVLGWGCRTKRSKPARRAVVDAAVAVARPGPALAAPRPVPVTAHELAFDQSHRAALLQIVKELDQLYSKSVAFQAQGVSKPSAQQAWPRHREGLVAAAGRVRSKVLAVDPLSNRSWAAARASVLLRYLTVKLPDAVRESWRSRPSGAFATWKSDFRLIYGRLRRYVENQLKKPSGPRSKDSR